MAFAARCGLDIDLKNLPGTPLDQLFNEELGAVLQVRAKQAPAIVKLLQKELGRYVHIIGQPTKRQTITIKNDSKTIYKNCKWR